MATILFVCSANRFRSVIAEAKLKSLTEKDIGANAWIITSAGTWAQAGLPPLPQAIKFAESHGLNIRHVRSKEIDQAMLEIATIVIVMTESQREALTLEFAQVKRKLFLLSEVFEGITYDIPDPIERLDETPEELGEEICRLISSGFPRIKDAISKIE
jgi:protein-tyrosine phosphatase